MLPGIYSTQRIQTTTFVRIYSLIAIEYKLLRNRGKYKGKFAVDG